MDGDYFKYHHNAASIFDSDVKIETDTIPPPSILTSHPSVKKLQLLSPPEPSSTTIFTPSTNLRY